MWRSLQTWVRVLFATVPAHLWDDAVEAQIHRMGDSLPAEMAADLRAFIEHQQRVAVKELVCAIAAQVDCPNALYALLREVRDTENRLRLLYVLQIALDTWVFPYQDNTCHKWVAAVRDRVVQAGTECFHNWEYDIKYVDWSYEQSRLFMKLMFGHGGLCIEIKKTNMKFYLDRLHAGPFQKPVDKNGQGLWPYTNEACQPLVPRQHEPGLIESLRNLLVPHCP
jgi:hypothetical protein